MRRGKRKAKQLLRLHDAVEAAKSAGAWEVVTKLLTDAVYIACDVESLNRLLA
jgi:hypothetical protein